jgi:hypothetical protein
MKKHTRAPIVFFSVALLTVSLLNQWSVSAQLSRPQAPQIQYSPQLVSEIKRVQQAALASDYAYARLAYLCNNIGPRLSGSPQAQAAVTYVAAELRKLGLEVKQAGDGAAPFAGKRDGQS